MIKKIYGKAITVLLRRPVKLWALSLLAVFLVALGSALCGLVPFIPIALSMLFEVGLLMVLLHGYLGEEVHTEQLFEPFRDWNTIKRIVFGVAYSWLWIFLWCLIPVVGIIFGIKKAYAYRLTPYILALEPDVRIVDAYKVSEKRTDGYKAKMFWADIIWVLVVILAATLLALLAAIPYIGWLFTVVLAVFSIAVSLLSELFTGLVRTAFYVEIQKSFPDAPQFDDSMNEPVTREKKAASEPEADAKFCPHCGTKNVISAKFCIGCGTAFESARQSETSGLN